MAKSRYDSSGRKTKQLEGYGNVVESFKAPTTTIDVTGQDMQDLRMRQREGATISQLEKSPTITDKTLQQAKTEQKAQSDITQERNIIAQNEKIASENKLISENMTPEQKAQIDMLNNAPIDEVQKSYQESFKKSKLGELFNTMVNGIPNADGTQQDNTATKTMGSAVLAASPIGAGVKVAKAGTKILTGSKVLTAGVYLNALSSLVGVAGTELKGNARDANSALQETLRGAKQSVNEIAITGDIEGAMADIETAQSNIKQLRSAVKIYGSVPFSNVEGLSADIIAAEKEIRNLKVKLIQAQVRSQIGL